ncbi:FAD-dependent oxidoreductase [Paenarthrobacter sp. PH39-S1]|uniref:FAD-dependent oxidoreductase n=1 Tax=Paenarthrobacter sp. PH39-S1 TaxID=3046204 RepID=UPI0024B8B496|nr:FAD-dependent oxidoreductase [Paenarthrobacter sp. PH39-S1]MDJ0355584.1 FAD-dependent oxidoreductase [Paenarthrobacter sp. PH39-S1]
MPASNELALEADVVVIGGGIVGLGIAWEAQRTGRSVTVIDPSPAAGATFAAAGMLAPVSELHYQEEQLLGLTLASAALWPEFVAPLAAAGHADTGFRTTATLVLGADAADRRALADLRQVQLSLGLAVDPLTIREARAEEPLLGPQLSCAFRVAHDHQVDPRGLATAIRVQLNVVAAASGRLMEEQTSIRRKATGLVHRDPADPDSRVTGVLLEDGRTVRAGEVVVANGLGAPALTGLPAGLRLPLRPVYGDILRLGVPEHLRPLLTSTVRGLVRGVPVYIVPRNDGTVVIGATQREEGVVGGSAGAAGGEVGTAGSSRSRDGTAESTSGSTAAGVSAGGVYALLRDAQTLVPAVAELELLETTARARPGTPDNAPLLGRVAGRHGDVEGLIIATGFFRHGVLLTPIAAQICRQLMNGITALEWTPFRPDRFSVVAYSAGAYSVDPGSAGPDAAGPAAPSTPSAVPATAAPSAVHNHEGDYQ